MISAKVLVSSSVLAAGTFVGSSVVWPGGRAGLVVNGAAYGATVQLQIQNGATSGSSAWAPVNATTLSADGVYAYDVPPGLIRMSCSGSSAGISATLITIPYV